MPDSAPNDAEISANAAVLAEVRGLRDFVEARFEGIEREQDLVREIVGRVSSTMDKIGDNLARHAGFEARLAHVEANQSDHALDLSAVQSELATQKAERVKTNFIRDGFIGFAGAVVSAIGIKLFGGAA